MKKLENEKKYDLYLDIENETSHKKIIEKIKKNSIVLEVGTASGHMTRYLKEKLNCNITGIEINQEMLKEASIYLDEVINLDLNNYLELDFKVEEEKYDYILLGDVLEHTYFPLQILEVLRKKIKESGEIIVSLPNASHNCILMQLLKNQFTYQEKGILDNTHIRFYTSESFRHIIKLVGLKLLKHEYTYMIPEFENLPFNKYEEFNLFEREVLLKHKNGHFFQNIFTLVKREVKEAELINIDSYWFDRINFFSKEKVILVKDIFDKNINIKYFLTEEIETLEINPSIRMRGIKNIILRINNNEYIPSFKNFINIGNQKISFGKGKIIINYPLKINDKLELKIEYLDITEEYLESLLEKLSFKEME